MRYILANIPAKIDSAVCAFCCTHIEKSYVRDLSTRITYCTVKCLEYHEQTSMLAIEYHAREVN